MTARPSELGFSDRQLATLTEGTEVRMKSARPAKLKLSDHPDVPVWSTPVRPSLKRCHAVLTTPLTATRTKRAEGDQEEGRDPRRRA